LITFHFLVVRFLANPNLLDQSSQCSGEILNLMPFSDISNVKNLEAEMLASMLKS